MRIKATLELEAEVPDGLDLRQLDVVAEHVSLVRGQVTDATSRQDDRRKALDGVRWLSARTLDIEEL